MICFRSFPSSYFSCDGRSQTNATSMRHIRATMPKLATLWMHHESKRDRIMPGLSPTKGENKGEERQNFSYDRWRAAVSTLTLCCRVTRLYLALYPCHATTMVQLVDVLIVTPNWCSNTYRRTLTAEDPRLDENSENLQASNFFLEVQYSDSR